MRLHTSLIWILVLVITAGFATVARAAEFSPALEAELAQASANEFVSAIIILESPIDIRALDAKLHAQRADRARRYREVISALHYNANQTQPAIRAELDAAVIQGDVAGYTAYWIENLFVIQARRSFIESLRSRGDIKYATENFRAELIEPVVVGPVDEGRRNPLDTRTLPPGIRAVNALRVNEELGITGSGTIIGGLDTGVDGTHPALAARWRGNFAPWSECWRDALGGGTQSPTDGHGHGTHTMGTMCGRRVSGTDTIWVGCAPAARWIADNAINQSVNPGFDSDIIDAFQWFANPDGNVNTLEDVPDVVQNSWGVNTSLGYPQCYDYWNTVILNCEAAGVVVTWSAGNEGSSGLRSPAIYQLNAVQIFSVGAVDATNYNAPYPIASFSSRGPTPCQPNPGAIKPEVVAPGVDVYSAYPGGGYTNMSGTSMAGPHVAGVVALMREACPNCDPITIKTVLMQTAIDYGTPGEDNTFGAGFIDAYAAVLAVMGDRGWVAGTIRDSQTMSPLPASVEVVGGSQSTVANANGYYILNLMADSTYTIRYSMYGYVSQEIPVSIVADDTVTQNVNLVARPIVVAFTEDFESGAPGWTHNTPGGQWIDQWHVSTERAHSATHSYKCGDTGTGTYAAYNDARLISPVISNLPDDSRLSYWYQIHAEISGAFPDSAYDGGIVELSANGGAFNQIFPIGNYPKTFRRSRGGGNPATGPMPGLRCYSDSIVTWQQASFDLSAYAGQNVQLRFRFGSDQGTNKEGWYVDDLMISGFGTVQPLEPPTGLVIASSGEDIILSWDADASPSYQIFSDVVPDGAFTTLEGTTASNTFTIPNGATSDRKFYLVRGYRP